MIQDAERSIIRVVARSMPWLAPLPSAYFVARSALVHLKVEPWMALIIAVVIESMGLATVHAALMAYDWNARKRKTDPTAPFVLAAVLCLSYLVVTLCLIVVLEVQPAWSVYAPAMFPFLALVGAITLAVVDHQDRRESGVERAKSDARAERAKKRAERIERDALAEIEKVDEPEPVPEPMTGFIHKVDGLDRAIMDVVLSKPDATYHQIADTVGKAKTTVGTRILKMKMAGIISDNGEGLVVRAER